MLETDRAQIIQDIRGINERLDLVDPSNVALLKGTYPEKIGLQSRVPGKTMFKKFTYPVNGIAVFYNTYGRRYLLWEGLDLTIEEVEWEPLTISWTPPWFADKYDDFEEYLEAPISSMLLGFWPSGNAGYVVLVSTKCYDAFETYLSGEITEAQLDLNTGEGTPVKWTETPHIVPIIPHNGMTFETFSTGTYSETQLQAEYVVSNIITLGDIDIVDMS